MTNLNWTNYKHTIRWNLYQIVAVYERCCRKSVLERSENARWKTSCNICFGLQWVNRARDETQRIWTESDIQYGLELIEESMTEAQEKMKKMSILLMGCGSVSCQLLSPIVSCSTFTTIRCTSVYLYFLLPLYTY